MKNKITKDYIAQFLPKKPVVIEAGAHKGKNTIEMSKLWPDAIIHAFEPTEIYDQLIKNTAEYSNISTYNIALDEISTQKTMYYCTGKYTQLSSLHKPAHYFTQNSKFKFNETIVNTITLDEWAEEYHIPKIDLLWLDAQGAELPILKGSSKILKNVKLLFLEANIIERYENAALYEELKNWLLKNNFLELASDEEIINNRFNILFVKKA